MMKHFLAQVILAGAMVAGVGLALMNGAQAAGSMSFPAGGVTGTGIELVSGGCGPGGFRDRFGYCRPMRRFEARRCPPAYHPTPYGCRRNY